MLQALGKNIIVKPVQEEEKEQTKLILTVKEKKPIYWEVLSVGHEVDKIWVGDFVFIHGYGMQEISYNNEKIFVVEVDKVYAKK